MDNVDLSRLNPTAFERLIRALCFAEMGLAGTVYSAGPDGARDFTYDGAIAGYEGKGWKGYLVLQVKFKDPSSFKVDDLTWLKSQLDKELVKYKNPASRLRKPEYYILVTNLRLSGSDGPANKKTGKTRKGSHAKALDLLASWKAELDLLGFDIWSHDKVADLLVAHPSIRQSYAQWTTAGDVLSKALENFKSIRPEFGEVANRWLKESLKRDQFVRLKDAGSVGDPQIRTSQVIVDLPLVQLRKGRFYKAHRDFTDYYLNGDDDDGEYKVPSHAIAQLVDRAREKLDAETVLADEERSENLDRPQVRNRIVLMGGPGQGKSTASLFLTQIFRAAILQNQASTRRDHGINKLVPEILKRANDEGISTSVPLRFPLHVSLPRFADLISATRQANNKSPSLLSYIASEMAVHADQDVERSDLRNWLRHYPWLLILDGLDEVPPTGERPAILDAISSFFTEVSEANADVLVVVTTRPQGYNQDLDEKLWEHWRLADLNPKQALSYAKAFGEARYPNDPSRREDVHRSLVKASDQPATARLMVSPLQVTILHFIVDTGGGVPTARWTLFNEYFEVLKRREKAKGGELQKYLERHWVHLGPIHHRAGLVLQTDSEHAGGAGSKFTQDRFRRLITAYLVSEGFEGNDLTQRVNELMELALFRLVLLSQQVEGTISFDVRSLQEFMAAAAITFGDQQIMETRLAHIAGHSHWRHVFQIAASRCFAEDGFLYRRSTITAIARQIDAAEPDLIVRNGARLALDLLADGIGLDHPNFRRPLLQHALEQIELGPDALDDRMANIWDLGTSDLAEIQISEKIVEGSSGPAICAWKLLFLLSQQGQAWADNLIIRLWPNDEKLKHKIFREIAAPLGSQRIADFLADAVSSSGPELALMLYFSHRTARRDEKVDTSRLAGMDLLRFRTDENSGLKTCDLLSDKYPKAYSVHYTAIDSPDLFERFSGADFQSTAWSGLRAVKDFTTSPSTFTFAHALRVLSACGLEVARELARLLPWPIATALVEAADEQDLERIAIQIEHGERGGANDWRAAERRWLSRGIVERDLLLPEDRWFGSNIADTGAPFWMEIYDGRKSGKLALLQNLKDIAEKMKNKEMAKLVLRTAAAIAIVGSQRKLHVNDAKLILDAVSSSAESGYPIMDVIGSMPNEIWSDTSAIEELAKILRKTRSHDEHLFYDEHSFLMREIIWLAFSNASDHQAQALIYPLVRSFLRDEPSFKTRIKGVVSRFGSVDSATDVLSKLALAILRLVDSAGDKDIDSNIEIILATNEDQDMLFNAVLNGDLIPVERRLSILTRSIAKCREQGSGRWRAFITPTRRALDSRKSGVGRAEIWNEQLCFPPESFSVLLPLAKVSG